MKVLIIGNMGYVGSVLVPHLARCHPHWVLFGLDTGYFENCLVPGQLPPETHLAQQMYVDVRDLATSTLFTNMDAVVYLAAISNDPMGELFSEPTHQINHDAAVKCYRHALVAGCQSFVFASSCSVYGAAGDDIIKECGPFHPVSNYAKSKLSAETGLRLWSSAQTKITNLRFGTACGPSPRIRLDLVANTFTSQALTTGRISVSGDGHAWRPIIDVRDMARAIEWAIQRQTPESFLSVNVGLNSANYRVREIASKTHDIFEHLQLVNSPNGLDQRSYRVCFDKYQALAPEHQPSHSLETSISDIYDLLQEVSPNRFPSLYRLQHLSKLVSQKKLSTELRWTAKGAHAAV
jgi:nucleoside-diphosphate-sugar epimerase